MPVSLNAPPQADFSQPLELLSDCHRRVERFLDTLARIADRAAKEPLNDEYVQALSTSLNYFSQSAVRHTQDEEDSLFPLLRASTDPRAAEAIAQVERLESDHRRADALHKTVDQLGRKLLEDRQLPSAHAARFRDAVAGLKAIYAPHIALEDTVLFPLARELLDAAALKKVGEEMAQRRRVAPGREGSRCAQRRAATLG